METKEQKNKIKPKKIKMKIYIITFFHMYFVYWHELVIYSTVYSCFP